VTFCLRLEASLIITFKPGGLIYLFESAYSIYKKVRQVLMCNFHTNQQ